ncbi:hypothetical protein ACGFXC_24400 [Streptomyces sp. NPDC048507]|uniref:hypothetical protein n=1 Tax=Streptomyces sp. NPDC048507 TaxID=3365560 RepID=UPI0037150499
MTTLLLTAGLILFTALLVAVATGKLARLDGATYPAACLRAGAAFAAVLTLASAITAAVAAVVD